MVSRRYHRRMKMTLLEASDKIRNNGGYFAMSEYTWALYKDKYRLVEELMGKYYRPTTLLGNQILLSDNVPCGFIKAEFPDSYELIKV